jgi:hypothetical protein
MSFPDYPQTEFSCDKNRRRFFLQHEKFQLRPASVFVASVNFPLHAHTFNPENSNMLWKDLQTKNAHQPESRWAFLNIVG